VDVRDPPAAKCRIAWQCDGVEFCRPCRNLKQESRMQVIEETITVLSDIDGPGLTLLMGGYRVALTREEARALVTTIGAALTGASGIIGAAKDERAAIVANVKDQVISWAKITDAVQRK
jgi:hypothetical protein